MANSKIHRFIAHRIRGSAKSANRRPTVIRVGISFICRQIYTELDGEDLVDKYRDMKAA